VAFGFLLQHLLANSAERRPEEQALAFEEAAISYAELEEASNRLARALHDQGVRRGDRVALYMNKSIASVIGIHGVLKAGAVYVPLDPNAPPKRLAFILDNCGVRHVVAATGKARAVASILDEGASLEAVIFADEGTVEAPPGPRCVSSRDVSAFDGASAPPNASIENDLAYILYTSGSTGTPKGVMISHANSLAFVDWAVDAIGVEASDRLSSHAPLHFDLSIFDVFGAMKAGAALALIPDGTSTFPIRLAEWIEHNRISIWYSVPAILTMLLQRGKLDQRDLSRLRTVIFAGEVFPTPHLRELQSALPGVELVNLYGPTETNVITWYRVPPLAADRDDNIPIGEACANTDLLVVADDGTLVTKPGVQGELYARGPTVAQGYWGDTDKTERAFVSNPFQHAFRERVYRTGDIVTWAPDGNLLLVGRRDRMVKIRGYRIELDEIEATLYGHADVKEAAVVAVADETQGARIRAFVAISDGVDGDVSALREHCLSRLPRYMVPETLDLLEQLPKTSTGKIDRTKLAASD